MAHFVLKDARVLFGPKDISGDVNQVTLAYAAEIKEANVMGPNSRQKLPGLKNVTMVHEGLYDAAGADPVDKAMFEAVAGSQQVVTVSPDEGSTGDLAFSFEALLASYSPGETVGSILPFGANAEGHGELVRGRILQIGIVTDDGYGTPRQLGAVGAGQRVYGALHVLAVDGTSGTLAITVQSASSSGFSAPSTRLSFAIATDRTAEMVSAAGPITDPWWRTRRALGGGRGAQYVVNAGIK